MPPAAPAPLQWRQPLSPPLLRRSLQNRALALLADAVPAVVVLPPLAWLGWAVGAALLRYGPVFPDAAARLALLRSVELGLSAAVIALLLGLPYGWLIARCRLAGGGFWRVASLLPLLLPPYAGALAWFMFLARDGAFNSLLLRWGWIGQPLQPFRSFWLAAWVMGGAYWPVVAWLTRLAARSVPRPLEDAARLQAGAGRAARWAAAPLLYAALPAGVLLVFLLSLGEFLVPNFLGLAFYPVEIVNRFQFDRDPGQVARLAVPLLGVVLPLLWVQLRLLRRLPLAPAGEEDPPLLGGRASAWGGALFCALVLVLTAGVPLGSLLAASLPLETYPAVWLESRDHFLNTLLSAAGGALLAGATALLHGWLRRGRTPAGFDFLLVLPYALPGSLIAVALIQLLNRPGPIGDLYNSAAALIWAYGVLFFPFAHKVLQPAWSRVDPELLQDGQVAGAGEGALFRSAAWPVVRPYAWLGTGLAALLAAREVDATALLRIPGGDTLAFRIQDYLHFAPTPKVAALCIWIVVLSAALCGVLARVLRGTEG